MTPKEFQKSNLAVELKAEKKRLEDALHGLSDEQCERPGATQFGSVMDLLSEIVTGELALMEVSDRLSSLPLNLLANGIPQRGLLAHLRSSGHRKRLCDGKVVEDIRTLFDKKLCRS